MIRSTRDRILHIPTHILLFAAAAVSLVPFVWLVCAAMKTEGDLFNHTFLPWDDLSRVTLANFRRLFGEEGFGDWLVNSLFIASLHTTLVVMLSSLGGFALAKYEFKGKKPLMILMLATMMLPGQVLMPSSYELMQKIGWINTYFALLVPGAVSVFGIMLFKQAMGQVPDELLQAARVDGCSELRLWWEISLPIVRPMIGAYTLMSFLGSWNSFVWPQVILQSERKFTLPMSISNMLSLPEYQSNYGILMAATIIGIVPVMLLFFALQKDFIAGLTSGAVKG